MVKKKDKLALVVSHNIFLTKKQRLLLVEGKIIEVVGISLPVWFSGLTGKTTEPGTEIFCKYKLHTEKSEGIIKISKTGYEIAIPTIKENKPILTDEEWLKMSFDEKEEWYNKNASPPNVNNLKNIKDGGAEYLRLEEAKEIKLPDQRDATIIHAIEIKSIEKLEKSIITEEIC